ncbi:UvrD-helicase domain-containing protein [Paenibacillus sp. 481]|nr:UvrD-helicase domain-containing protein [Paenibacillus sp. 481]
MPKTLPVKPEESTWTDEQWRAIVDGGENILVAAAAGSGKTAVLVERIIRKISDEAKPVHVDQLLVATFTKAAAAEMRERIRIALERELERNLDSEHLRRQLALLNRASITTLHSFCLEVIQRHFQTIGLDPSFRVANETETELLRQDVLEQLFEERYAAEDTSFRRMIDWFSGERNDEAAFRLVHRLYEFSRSHPWPGDWLDGTAAAFEAEDIAALGQTAWASSVMADARLTLHGIVELLKQALRLTEVPGGPEPYRDTLAQELQGAIALLQAAQERPWETMHEAFDLLSFGRLAACRGDKYEKSLQEQVKRLRDQAKTRLQQLSDELFRRTPAQFLHELHAMAPVMHTLSGVVQQFGSLYEQAKRDKGFLDFSDLEHYCLRILRDPQSTPAHTLPSEAALQYQEQFAEILLDEYQDTNMVQEAIVDLITKPGSGNRFMVGDVKQSIYRFRLAEPGLFLNKYRTYDAIGRGNGTRIDLARNFRSRAEVVDAVNMIFRQIMNPNVAELDYDQAAELVCGASYPTLDEVTDIAATVYGADQVEAQSFDTELIVIEKKETAESPAIEEEDVESEQAMNESGDTLDASEIETARLEARAIAARIRRLLGDAGEPPFLVYDKQLKRMRPVTYRDIVILLRATQAWAPLIVEELRLGGIPAYAEFSTGYFQATEVSVILSLLRVIDNPLQDIPLASVLRSPIVGLNAEQMAQVRIAGKDVTFYDALLELVSATSDFDQGEDEQQQQQQQLLQRLRHFLHQFERWRDEARQGRLSDLIWRIYRETGYYEWIGGLAGGMQRQANLRALYDRARQYESSSVRGLFRFLRFIDRMRETGGDLGTARALGEQEDVVRIMTIHKSKGLEFPVVFVAGLAKKFNQQDLNASFLMHKQLGFGPKFVDEELRVTYPTLPNLAIRRQMKLELLAEELRVLYVALTRPKEKMILVGTVNDAEKAIVQWGEALDCEPLLLPDYTVAKARSYLDWLGPAVIRHPAASEWRRYAGLPNRNGAALMDELAGWKLSLMPANVLALATDSGAEAGEVDETMKNRLQELTELSPLTDAPSSEHSETLLKQLSWRDPYRLAAMLPAKTTVTEMKRLASSEEWPASSWVETQLEESEEPITSDAAAEPERSANEISNRPDALVYANSEALGVDSMSLQPPSNKESAFTLHLRRPRFMEQTSITPAERGTAYHLLMQHLSLHAPMTADIVKQTLDHMVDKQLMTAAQAAVMDIEAVMAFFESEVGQQLQSAAWVKRELPFSYGITATEAYTVETALQQDAIRAAEEARSSEAIVDKQASTENTENTENTEETVSKESAPSYVATATFAAYDDTGMLNDETVLVQGVIDCIFEVDGKLILLDYKTDKVLEHRGGLPALVEHYRFQLNIYARAIEHIWKRPVDAKVLYFFDAQQACEL